ncbi:unnamed protein product [Rotaria sp. Silwood1]|nr:unnamed protein product [Rotaria sp. Silwood1]
MVVIFPKLGRQLSQYEMLTETCSKDMKDKIAILNYSIPLYTMAFIMVAVTLFYFACFKCKYKRRRQH